MWSVRIGYRGLLARRYFVISCEAIAPQWFLIYRARTPGYRGPTSREDATATPALNNGPTIVDAVNERSDLWRSVAQPHLCSRVSPQKCGNRQIATRVETPKNHALQGAPGGRLFLLTPVASATHARASASRAGVRRGVLRGRRSSSGRARRGLG